MTREEFMKFTVRVKEVHTVVIDIEAATEQEAQSLAEEAIEAGCLPDGTDLPEAVYEYTLDRDEWPVYQSFNN